VSYAQQSRNPARHLVSIGIVIVLHVLLIWGLMSGLARKVVQVIKAPIETKIIEDVKPPPPPPERIELPPPPKFMPPPPVYVPPPEVQVQVPPPPPQQTITVTPAPPPPEPPPPVAPRVEPPPPAPAPAPAPAPPPPAPMTAAIICPGYTTVLSQAGVPREALRAGIDRGSVELKLTIAGNGTIKNVEVVKSTNRAFNRGAMEAARGITCQGQGREVEVLLPIDYRLQ
jgi:protein TonB